MNPYVSWVAAMVVCVCGMVSSWVLRRHPRWAARAAAVMAGASVVVVGNEALRTRPTAYVGVWVLIAGTTFMNWWVCRRADRDHQRRVIETLELLAEMSRVQRDRARLIAQRGELPRDASGVGIWPRKEC